MTQFNRKYIVTVDTIEITMLDLSFTVTKTLEREPNTCDLTIYNLNPEHRKQLSMVKGGPAVKVEAGYADDCGVLFLGQLEEVYSHKEGSDWITELHSGDAASKLAKARTNRSYNAGTEVGKIIGDTIKDMGVGIGNSLKALMSGDLLGAKNKFANAVTLSGPSTHALDRMLSSVGKEWSIQDGQIQVMDKRAFIEGTAVLLNADTGMIGSPTIGNDGVLKVKALLNHKIVPGRKLMIESAEIKKSGYRVERVEYTGETYGQAWYVDIEAKAY